MKLGDLDYAALQDWREFEHQRANNAAAQQLVEWLRDRDLEPAATAGPELGTRRAVAVLIQVCKRARWSSFFEG